MQLESLGNIVTLTAKERIQNFKSDQSQAEKNVIERSVILSNDELTDSVLPSDFIMDGSSDSFALASVEKIT